jgi:uncharacterized damage-inducible protein DinB
MDLTAAAFLARSRYYLSEEYIVKIERALAPLPPGAIWRRDDEGSNSIGNLLVHLAGNVRQWIVSGVGGAPDHRTRSTEFEAREGPDGAALLAALREAIADVDAVLSTLDDEALASRRTIQGRDVSVLDAVYHVVEHFSMHTGQIIMLAKRHAPGRIRFYEDAGGLAIPRWRDPA